MNIIFGIAQKITKNKAFNVFIFFLILLTAIIIGIETYPDIASKQRSLLDFLDRLIISIFAIEISLKILSNGKMPWSFFADPWNVFDFIIVTVCLIPAVDTHLFAVVRILRILRILRMITFFPKLRPLIGILLKSIPSRGFLFCLLPIFSMFMQLWAFLFLEHRPYAFWRSIDSRRQV